MPNRRRHRPGRRAVLGSIPFLVLPRIGLRALVGATTVGAIGSSASPGSGAPEFRRGIGVVHPLGWADVGTDGTYVFPPFAGPSRDLGPAQVRILRTAGFDFLRLAVDPGPFLHFRGSQRDWLDARLLDVVRAVLDGGLGAIVDFHPSGMHPAYRPSRITVGAETRIFREFLDLVRRTATYLETMSGAAARRGARARLALELLNEPEVPPRDWQPMLASAYRAARAAAPRLPLVVGGGSQNSADALEAVDLSLMGGDQNVIYTFHDYTPWQFTHQGVEGHPAFHLTNVPYPPRADLIEQSKAATRLRIRADRRDARAQSDDIAKAEGDLDQYARLAARPAAKPAGGQDDLDGAFDRISGWCSANRIPPGRVLLGEFGVHLTPYHRTAEGALARARWLREMRERAEARGFGWSAWDYAETGGFGIAEDPGGLVLDRTVLTALGLRTP